MRADSVPAAMLVGGVPVAELASAYGTPLLAIDTERLDAAIARFAGLGRRFGIDVAYAGKALLPVALVRRLAASPLGLDVCSLGELAAGERGGMPAARMVMHGCGKTPEELEAIVAGRVGSVVADHMPELRALAGLADPARPVDVLLRCNPGVASDTHAKVRTSGDATKFGFASEDLAAAVAAVRAAPGLRLRGLHAHLGSQLFAPEVYRRALEIQLRAFAAIAGRGRPDASFDTLVIGGGFGVDALAGGRRLDVTGLLGDLAQRLRAGALDLGVTPPRLGIEPGRAIVAEAGTSIYRVVAVKDHAQRRFAIVDGGIADNPRPALYDAFHEPVAHTGRVALAQTMTTVCGRACENDELVTAPLPEDLQPGDLITLATTGAYVYPMASNYNRFPRPPLIFAGDGAHRVVVRRETPVDLLRYEVDT